MSALLRHSAKCSLSGAKRNPIGSFSNRRFDTRKCDTTYSRVMSFGEDAYAVFPRGKLADFNFPNDMRGESVISLFLTCSAGRSTSAFYYGAPRSLTHNHALHKNVRYQVRPSPRRGQTKTQRKHAIRHRLFD